jgi:hypothetical protein
MSVDPIQSLSFLARACKSPHQPLKGETVLERMRALSPQFAFFEVPFLNLQTQYSNQIAVVNRLPKEARIAASNAIKAQRTFQRYQSLIPHLDTMEDEMQEKIDEQGYRLKSMRGSRRDQLLGRKVKSVNQMKELSDVSKDIENRKSKAFVQAGLTKKSCPVEALPLLEIIREKEKFKAQFFISTGWDHQLLNTKTQNAFDAIIRSAANIKKTTSCWDQICCSFCFSKKRPNR